MENSKALLIGKLFDLLLVDKNFSECVSKNIENKFTILEFKTPYVGKSNWIKIKIRNNIFQTMVDDVFVEPSVDLELLIDRKLEKFDNISIDNLFVELEKISVRNG